MLTVPIGFVGTRLDLAIRQGAQFGPVSVAYVDAAGAPIDLSGCTLVGVLKKNWDDPTPAATFTTAWVSQSGGTFTISLPDTVTATLSAGAQPTNPESQYVWQLDVIDATPETFPMYRGVASVTCDLDP